MSTASPIPAPPAPEAPPASCTDTFAGAAPSSVEPVKGSLYQQSLKTSSVTIRMSAAECSQLHRRAAEAGMTVSAYLRSCAFELESMRRLVKDTMAQLKQANARVRAQAQAPELEAHRMSWWHRLTHWLIPWRADDHQPARA